MSAPDGSASGGAQGQMMDMWNKVKSGANAAATSVRHISSLYPPCTDSFVAQLEIAAEKTKLQAEISYIQSRIKNTKKEMGLQIYDAMAIGDQNEVSRVFGTFKSQVDSFEAQIQEKRARIEVLDLQRQ